MLYLVARKFIEIDLHPYQRTPDGSLLLGPDGQPESNVTNHEMGVVFEELIRRFSEQSNETAGEHFTPREVIAFMVNLLFAQDDQGLQQPSIMRTLYDPACGTGGMLSVAEDHLGRLNPQARLQVYGQELNDESYAICKADMLVKGQAADNIKCGNSFSADELPDRLEAIVALPDQMFYNTGISTYIWLLTNRKAPERRGKVQLINGVNRFRRMRKSLGDKRKELGPDDIDTLTRLYADFQEGPEVKAFDNTDFGFHRITVERPLRLNFQASAERIARADEKTWSAQLTSKKKGAAAAAENLEGEVTQKAVLDLLKTLADPSPSPVDQRSAVHRADRTALQEPRRLHQGPQISRQGPQSSVRSPSP